MGAARKLPNGKWEKKISLGKDHSTGKYLQKKFTADTKKAVELQANTYLIDYQRTRAKANNPLSMTLGEAMQAYIDIKRDSLSITTIRGYERIMRNDFLDIQGYCLKDLTLDIVQNSINNSAKRLGRNENCKNSDGSRKKLSKKSLKNASGFLSAVLNRYYPEFRYKVDIPKGESNTHEHYLHDVDTVIRIVKGSSIELAVWLGMFSFRMSEILGFKKSDVDFETGYIYVSHTVVYDQGMKVYRNHGKTAQAMRSAMLPPYVLDLIRALPEKQEFLVDMKAITLQNHWNALQEQHYLEHHMCLHDLRHLHASITKSVGIPDYIRQELGGWSNPVVMNGVYTEVLSEDRQLANEKIVAFFNQHVDALLNINVCTQK